MKFTFSTQKRMPDRLNLPGIRKAQMVRKSLREILSQDESKSLEESWDSIEAADKSFSPLPAGTYESHIIDGELFHAKSGTPGYKLTYRVCDGEYSGSLFWQQFWLTDKALPYSKGQLQKLGYQTFNHLRTNEPIKGRLIRCRVILKLRPTDDGRQFTEVRSFEVLGEDQPEPEPYAPQPETDEEDDEGAES
jgi:hypothetical protein